MYSDDEEEVDLQETTSVPLRKERYYHSCKLAIFEKK